MAKWEKLGLVFSPQKHSDKHWMQEFAQAPSVIIHENFIRVYFSTRPKPVNGQYSSYSAYIDLDRKNLKNILAIAEQPILELGKLGTFDEFGTYPASVIKNENQFICYYAGWTRCESVPFNVALGRGVSNDGGKTFSKSGDGPILSYSPEEPFILSGPKIRKFNDKWVLWYIAGKEWLLVDDKPEPIYTIRMAESEDGINWKKHGKELIPAKFEKEAQASPDVIYKNGKYHMFFCYRHGNKRYRGKEYGYRIGYAFSDDMKNWTRNDELVGIDVSETGWDSEMISYPHVFELDGEIYMFYLGNQVGKEGFGLAKLKGTL
jgi:predicted GH43/DUF377 family glycosyl hydrolase